MIVAAACNRVIGDQGRLPWQLPDDLARFRALTLGHALIAGRLTHESILLRNGQPLRGRVTVVVSRTAPPPAAQFAELVLVRQDLAAAVAAARQAEEQLGGQEVFVIGGAQIYRQLLPLVDRIELTRIHDEVTGDTHLPADWLEGFDLISQSPADGLPEHSFLTYQRADHPRPD